MERRSERLDLNEVSRKAGSGGLCSHMQLDCPFSLTQAKAHHVVIKVRANVHRQEYVSCDEAVFIHSKEPCIKSEEPAPCTAHRQPSAQSEAQILLVLVLLVLRTPAPAPCTMLYKAQQHCTRAFPGSTRQGHQDKNSFTVSPLH